MPAVLIAVPYGKIIPPKGSLIPKYYLGALEQADALKEVMGPETEVVGEIQMHPAKDTSESDTATADRFVKLIRAGKPAIAMIRAMDEKEAYWKFVHAVSPDMWVPNPRQLAIVEALPLPPTDEEWRQSLEWTTRIALGKFTESELTPAVPAPARP